MVDGEGTTDYRLRRMEEDIRSVRQDIRDQSKRVDSIKTMLISVLIALILQLLGQVVSRVFTVVPH